MPFLEPMPFLTAEEIALNGFGQRWTAIKKFSESDGKQFVKDLSKVFDDRIGRCLATMLGVKTAQLKAASLLPTEPDVVEIGPVRVVGGIRPQNFDVGYRPDGVRFVHDTKTLNEKKSVCKNFQNMINDIGTEATTVHTRFPFAVVAFMVIIPSPCFPELIRKRFTPMLDRLVGRDSPDDLPYKAEAVSLVLWDPETNTIDLSWPESNSPLRIEKFSEFVQAQYHKRYDGMAPHDKPSAVQKKKLKEVAEALEDNEEDAEDGNGS